MTSVTLPMPIDGPGVASGRFDQFRLHSAIEIRALLARLVEGNVLLHLSAPDGAVYTTTLWALDAQRGVASFAVDAASPQLQRVLAADEITVVGYIVLRLTRANLHNDDAALAECQRLIEPVREAWSRIASDAAPR